MIMAYCKANQLDCNGFCNRFDAPCIKKNCRFFGVKTNSDRIRAMTDEELADWLAKTQIANVAEVLRIVCVPWEQHTDLQELTAKDCLEWLKQPAEV
jgi:crotonobetainyl-CoA:carnitine CoA-transferase CaiB-like acyl-CoA transferase